MTRSNLLRLVLIVGSILIIIGVTLMLWNLVIEKDPNVIEIHIKDLKKPYPIEFENLCLIPGEQCEYRISLKGDRSNTCSINFDFVELEESKLKDFARVKIESKDGVLLDELLVDAFDNDNFEFPVDFSKKKNTELKVVYYLPLEVGNEAKKADAVFELIVTAINE